MNFSRAITRKPSESFTKGISTAGLGAPDIDLTLKQHQAYCEALESCGLEVTVLESLPDYPDCPFVEDTSVIIPEMAIVCDFGADSRKGEENFMKPLLEEIRPVAHIDAPGTMEGGDVLLVDKNFYIGLSERTNLEGVGEFGALVEKHGYSWTAVPVIREPHLKTSVTWVGGNNLIMTPEFEGREEFADFNCIVVDEDEAYAGCCLFINGTVIMPAGYPKAKAELEKLGNPIIELEMSEFEKVDGGLTCLSLRF